ncbi:MAG: hypothetical protein QOD10_6001 [Mycobacterium sp.]|jgi:hypothetical protein|nr:hypothetical protein [Mycobacterium sp.]
MSDERSGTPWDEMTLRQRDAVWRRSDVLEAAKHAIATVDNEARPWARAA